MQGATAVVHPVPQTVTIEVDDGTVRASTPEGYRSRLEQTRIDAVDEQLIGVFDRWLARSPDGWARADVSAFGSLLFRALLVGETWDFVLQRCDELLDGQRVRLQLSFPATPAGRHLAALPWEYLHVPDGTGMFLGTDERFLLSRTVSTDVPPTAPAVGPGMTVLLVVSQPTDEADVVVETIDSVLDRLQEGGSVTVERVPSPTPRALEEALRDVSPDVLHFVGHGKHEAIDGEGRVALVDVAGTANWLSGQDVAQILKKSGADPRLVLLQSCSGAKESATASFAGVAPQLVRNGPPCVIGMRYDVRPEVASTFAAQVYEALLEGDSLDGAAQRGRGFLADPTSPQHDPRLIGLPVVYAHDRPAALDALVGGS